MALVECSSEGVLRAPPFAPIRPRISNRHRRDEPVSLTAEGLAPVPAERMTALRLNLCAARVGGAFWARPAGLPTSGMTVFRPPDARRARSWRDALLRRHASGRLWALLPPTAWARRFAAETARLGVGASLGDIDPWSVFDQAGAVVADPEGEIGLLAAVAGLDVAAGPEDDARPAEDVLARMRREFVGRTDYRHPFEARAAECEEIVDVMADWRRVLAANRGLAACVGVAPWKRREVRQLLYGGERPIAFRRSARSAVALAVARGGAVAVWPSRTPRGLEDAAAAAGVPLVRIEDGFVRSAGLGSDLWPPGSIIVDRRGVHFDPDRPSDLEAILQETTFDPALLARARRLADLVRDLRVTKYNLGGGPAPRPDPARETVLVTGQVEDDLSFVLGGGQGNLALLRRARTLEPLARILFKPHPDVERGHRKGRVPDGEALAYADQIVRDTTMPALLDAVDRVHTVSSLSGFEALLRGRPVVAHGKPFYAGWGLTTDLQPIDRRSRRLTLEELVAGALILYPRYIDPRSRLPCPPEVFVRRLAEPTAARSNPLVWLRRLQGEGRKWAAQFGAGG